MTSGLFAKNYNRALRFLSFRPRSKKEIFDYFLKKEVDKKLVEEIIQKLEKEKFVNDDEFAKWFIESRVTNRPKSHRVIKMELKHKGIDVDKIEALLANTTDDAVLAKKLVEKKLRAMKNVPIEKKKERLVRYLSTRGFDWSTIRGVIDEAGAEIV